MWFRAERMPLSVCLDSCKLSVTYHFCWNVVPQEWNFFNGSLQSVVVSREQKYAIDRWPTNSLMGSGSNIELVLKISILANLARKSSSESDSGVDSFGGILRFFNGVRLLSWYSGKDSLWRRSRWKEVGMEDFQDGPFAALSPSSA
jgi:hypothetical protein